MPVLPGEGNMSVKKTESIKKKAVIKKPGKKVVEVKKRTTKVVK